MTYQFTGTAEDSMDALFEHLERVRWGDPQADLEFRLALVCLVALYDRQAKAGPVETQRLERFRIDSAETLLQFEHELGGYIAETLVIAEDATEGDWYELCMRRSAIQSLVDDYATTRISGLIDHQVITQIDAEMRRAGSEFASVPKRYVPRGLSPNHWWWRYASPSVAESDPAERLAAARADGQRVSDLDLKGAMLARQDLTKLHGDRLNFADSDLRYASLALARMSQCDFEAALCGGLKADDATLRLCRFDGALAAGASFDRACFEDCSVRGADLAGASLRRSQLTDTSFERTVLTRAAFDGAHGDSVGLRGADLDGATLVGVQFDDADFRGANLTGADLSQGRFHSADFRGALLDGTCFDGADLHGAQFDAGAKPIPAPRPDGQAAPPAPVESADDAQLAAWLSDGLAALQASLAPSGGTAQPSPLLRALLARAGVGGPEPLARWRDALTALDPDGQLAAEAGAQWQAIVTQGRERLAGTAWAPLFDELCAAVNERAAPEASQGDTT